MPAETTERRCEQCGMSGEEIRRSDPIRVPSVTRDDVTRRDLCNACWAKISLGWQLKQRRA